MANMMKFSIPSVSSPWGGICLVEGGWGSADAFIDPFFLVISFFGLVFVVFDFFVKNIFMRRLDYELG